MKLEVRVGVWKRKLLLLCVTTAVLWGCRNNTSIYAKGYDPSKRDCSFLRQKHEFYHTISLYNCSTWISHSVVHSYRPIWTFHTINRAIVDVIVRSTFSYAFTEVVSSIPAKGLLNTTFIIMFVNKFGAGRLIFTGYSGFLYQ